MEATSRSPSQVNELAELSRPVSMAGEQAFPVLPALDKVLPNSRLQRGWTVVVQGGPGVHSLALALAAEASGAGSWVAVVGVPSLGMTAAAELGVVLERLILIASPPSLLWPTVAAALIDGFDIVVVNWPGASGNMARRLSMRTRDRRTVLIPVTPGIQGHPWNEAADIRLSVDCAGWRGLGSGHGRLSARRLEIETSGRRCPLPRRTSLWLPDHLGGVAVAEPLGPYPSLKASR